MQWVGALEGRPWKKAVTLYRGVWPTLHRYPTPLPCTATLYCYPALRSIIYPIYISKSGQVQGRLLFVCGSCRVGRLSHPNSTERDRNPKMPCSRWVVSLD